MSHEFRTPLMLMLGPLEDALASSDLPSGEWDRLTVAHRNSLRLLKLVNTLLDFSRIEAGRVQAVYEPTDLAAATAARQYQNAAPAERAHVLLADDNADMRNYVRHLLASQYEVEVVADGGAALSAIARRKPDLVLSDIMMPHLDGMELVSRLRADPQTNTLPIILLSARAAEESRVEGMQAGADDYLIKPFSARELLARVEAHVKIARVRRDAEQALRDEQERWQLAAHVGRFGQWHLDLVTRAVDLSASCKAIFGLPPEEQASAERLFSLIHADDREAVVTRLNEAVETRTAYEVEYRVIWPDGSLHWINSRGSASYAPDGTALKVVGVTLDITERKRGEEHLRMLVAELDHRVKNVLATVSAVTSRMSMVLHELTTNAAKLGAFHL